MRLHHLLAPLILLAALGALALRAGNLDHRPMHGDEAVNADKFRSIYDAGTYQYDPHQFHGPTLPYLTIPAAFFAPKANWQGLDESDYRWVAVVAGVFLVAGTVLLRGGLSGPSLAFAAILTAISPAFVFYSRYYIHEMLLVLFTFGAIAAAWKYHRRPRLRWAIMAGTCLALMQATKETSVIAYFSMAGAFGLSWAWGKWVNPLSQSVPEGDGRPGEGGLRRTSRAGRVRGPSAEGDPANSPTPSLSARGNSSFLPPRLHLAAGLISFLLIIILFFSSFFTHWSGVWDAVRAYTHYFDRARSSIHVHPWHYYLDLLIYTHNKPGPTWSEGFILLLGLIGATVALCGGVWHSRAKTLSSISIALKKLPWAQRLLPQQHEPPSPYKHPAIAAEHVPLARWLVFYTLLMMAVYSLIPYKTPWCLLSFHHGMILLAGVGAAAILRVAQPRPVKMLAALLLALWSYQLYTQAQTTISERFDTDALRNPYVYAHPTSNVRKIENLIMGLAQVHPDGRRMVVEMVIDNPWPLPWYLRRLDPPQRDTENPGWWETPSDRPASQPLPPVMLVQMDMLEEMLLLKPELADYWQDFSGLRGDVPLAVLVRKDLFELRQAQRAATQPK